MASVLTILSTFPPEAWDAIVPRYRGARLGARPELADRFDMSDRFGHVALNPQPLPPRERFLLAAADLGHEIGRLAVETDLTQGSGSGLLRELVDDWCLTGWPRRWPFPWPGPGPRPDEVDLVGGRLAGALVLASLGERMAGTDLGTAFTETSEKLAEVALRG